MTKKKSSTTQITPPIRESWEIWNYLISQAGLDTICYDNEFLNGNTSFNGLSQYLGFKVDKKTIGDKLKKHHVSAERFIGAFFKVLQPYAQMMNDLCVFFSNYKVNSTNERLRIIFDFGGVTEQLDFNLETFRSTLSSYSTIKKKVTFYHIPDVWDLHRIFRHDSTVDKVRIKNSKAADWLDQYNAGKITKPDLTFKATGYSGLNLQLQRILDLWTDYVNTCRDITENVNEYWGKLGENEKAQKGTKDQDEQFTNDGDIAASWSLDNLRAESDRWSATMIELFYSRLESLQRLSGLSKDHDAAELEESLQSFFDGLPKTEKEFDDVIEQLIDLLNLPVWKKRYELFSTWILSAIDQALAGYERMVHDNGGVLLLNFSATHLMTVQSANGPFELWAENRTLLTNPTGHGRKNGIQPDYTIYQSTVGDPKDCIVCIEVKQYKKASVRNFGNAINDYANGLPNAHIFLTNYGPVPVSLPLIHPSRSAYFGEVRPSTSALDTFKKALLSALPPIKVLSPQEIIKLKLIDQPIETLYLDVSGSMDQTLFKQYIRAVLTALLKRKKVKSLVALDINRQFKWDHPEETDLEVLLSFHFYSGGDYEFRSLITDSQSLIITDRNGAIEIYESDSQPIVIMLEDEKAELYVHDDIDLGDYIFLATEALTPSADQKEAGFPDWFYPAEVKV